MSTPSQPRSVKISQDERTGWSSDRPRGDGPSRPANVSVSNRVLKPSDRLRYAPGSLLLIVAGAAGAGERFAAGVIEKQVGVLSMERVRGLLEGKVAEEEREERAEQLLAGAVAKRLEANDAAVVVLSTLDPEERERYVRLAAPMRRPRHLIFLDASASAVPEEQRAPLNALRSALDAGQLGAEGFHTALRLGGSTVSDVKRVLFRPEPRDDDR